MKAPLKNMGKSASDESNGFGGNIIDPRICTSIPTVKEALDGLIATLKLTNK